jgi:hypothetical protein
VTDLLFMYIGLWLLLSSVVYAAAMVCLLPLFLRLDERYPGPASSYTSSTGPGSPVSAAWKPHYPI